MINHLNAFYSRKMEEQNPQYAGSISYKIENAGNYLLKPVRYLLNGRNVWVYRKDDFTFDKLSAGEIYYYFSKRKTLIKVIGAIILCVPSFFLGTLVKGMAQLAFSARERHRWAATHCTKVPRKDIQTETGSMEEIKTKLFDPYQRKIDVLVIRGNCIDYIGPHDTIGLNYVEIGKKLILINTAITNSGIGSQGLGAEEALNLQGFENKKFDFSPTDDEVAAIPQKELKPVLSSEEGRIEGYIEHIYVKGKCTNPEALSSPCTEEEYRLLQRHFLQEKVKERQQIQDRYFTKHPQGLMSKDIGQTSLGEYLVKDVASALQDPLPKNSKRVYMVMA